MLKMCLWRVSSHFCREFVFFLNLYNTHFFPLPAHPLRMALFFLQKWMLRTVSCCVPLLDGVGPASFFSAQIPSARLFSGTTFIGGGVFCEFFWRLWGLVVLGRLGQVWRCSPFRTCPTFIDSLFLGTLTFLWKRSHPHPTDLEVAVKYYP